MAEKETFEGAEVVGELSGPLIGSCELEKWIGAAVEQELPLAVRELLPAWDEAA